MRTNTGRCSGGAHIKRPSPSKASRRTRGDASLAAVSRREAVLRSEARAAKAGGAGGADCRALGADPDDDVKVNARLGVGEGDCDVGVAAPDPMLLLLVGRDSDRPAVGDGPGLRLSAPPGDCITGEEEVGVGDDPEPLVDPEGPGSIGGTPAPITWPIASDADARSSGCSSLRHKDSAASNPEPCTKECWATDG